MSARDDGGPAFPSPDLGEREFGQRDAYPGMTLRDYFATEAMKALLHPGVSAEWVKQAYGTNEISVAAYAQADAMLKARKT